VTISMKLRAFPGDRGGSIAVLFAVLIMVATGLSALAVDVGSLYLERRTVQGAADLAAIAAAANIDRAEETARATLRANGIEGVSELAVVKGRYVVDPAVAHGLRFQAGVQPHNAVRLDVALPGQIFFAKAFVAPPQIAVSAMGAADATAMFSIGSRLAGLRGGLVNALLGALLGANINLSVMDYDALVNANVSLLSFLSALSTEVGLTAGTYEQLLSADAKVGQVLRASAAALQKGGNAVTAQVLTALAAKVPVSAKLPLSAIVDLGQLANAAIGHPPAALAADVNVMSLVTAAAGAANGSRQLSVNLGAQVPGLLGLTLDVAVGDHAQKSGWVAVGHAGATIKTAQTRLRLLAEVGGSGLLAGIRVRLPVYIEIASAEARLEALRCGRAPQGEAVIAARPAAVRAWIGEINPAGMSSFSTSPPVSYATLVSVPLLHISAKAYVEMANAQAVSLTFDNRDVEKKAVKTAEVRDFLTSVTSSLLKSVDLNIDLIGIPLGSVSAITSALLAVLSPLTAALDPLLGAILDLVGVHLGEVDVQVHGIGCGNAVLAG
jgi:uncharacterized membrane protein